MLSWFVKVRLWVGVLRDLDRLFWLQISIWNIGKDSWRAFLWMMDGDMSEVLTKQKIRWGGRL